MRLDKYLSNLKYGSRKEIDQMVKKNLIKVNGQLMNKADIIIHPKTDQIYVYDQLVPYFESIHLAFYKPKGYLSAHHDAIHPCVMELLLEPYHRYPLNIAGRLDLDAHGLLIMTTDGMLIHNITHPKKHLKKRYEVILDKPFKHHQNLLDGIVIKDQHQLSYEAKALFIKHENQYVTIDIDEGKFHQVKRMFEALNYQVLDLKRTMIGRLSIGDLEPGSYKTFLPEELYD